jgi:hypothetical protein
MADVMLRKSAAKGVRERAGEGGLAWIDGCGNTAFEGFQPRSDAERRKTMPAFKSPAFKSPSAI